MMHTVAEHEPAEITVERHDHSAFLTRPAQDLAIAGVGRPGADPHRIMTRSTERSCIAR